MAEDTTTKEKEATRHEPIDVMVATFADRQAAKDAYRTLRSMDKEGRIALDGAVVIDRDELGKMRLEGATLPGWVWAAIAGSAAVMFGIVGLLLWGIVRTVTGLGRSDEVSELPEGRYTESRRMME
jgi:uncharacterized membrane protein